MNPAAKGCLEGKSDWQILICNFGDVEILTRCEQNFTSLIAKLPHGGIFLGISLLMLTLASECLISEI